MAAHSTPAEAARQATALAAAGDPAAARELFDRALDEFPRDAALLNSAGNFHARQGDNARAFALFDAAMRIDASSAEAALNKAVVALRLDRPRAAHSALLPHETAQSTSARYWLLRADAAKALGEYGDAAAALERARVREPGNQRVATATARLLLESGADGAVEAYEAALLNEPGNFDLMLGYVQALQAHGLANEAREFAEGLAAHFPSWLAGQAALAELRWEAGEHNSYTSHFGPVVAAHSVPASYLAWADRLSGNDLHDQAADVLEQGLALWPEDGELALARAIALGEAGYAADAEKIFNAFTDLESSDWTLARSRNALRMGHVEHAGEMLETLTRDHPGDIAAWALLDLCWRIREDPRHEWLHGQPGLVSEIELGIANNTLAAIGGILERFHAHAPIPLGQSVKGGTQTRGALFARNEPELAQLKAALQITLETYRRALPPADPTHPLLAHRDAPWRIAGSWSVRFSERGRHAAHIHPRGILSSAIYFVVPNAVEAPGGPGWLELGRPPTNLATDLHPLAEIMPRVGHGVLFPSTLFHGTRTIETGTRMTVAFDIDPER